MKRRCPRPARKFVFESLETRLTLHGDDVIVTPTHVIAGKDSVPRFAANAEFVAVRDGLWSDPTTWNLRRVPGQNAKVQIPHTMDVVYNTNSVLEIKAIEVSGTLDFARSIDTKLFVSTLMVMPDGALSIGTQQSPIIASAEIVFPDKPLDTVADPEQWGNGLLVFGKIDIYGTRKTSSYVRLAQEPRAGSRELVLAEVPTGWKAGDVIVLPDTSSAWDEGRIEELEIASVQGNRVTLKSPLGFDHRGARLADGTLQSLPHIGNLSRTVTIRSENMQGVLGHTAYFARADVHIYYAMFEDLGRTTSSDLDDTTFNADGSVSRIGTNQAGRYAVHFHHLIGPENPTNTGYQLEFVGNSVECSMRWAVVLHTTSYARVTENIIYEFQGAGIVTEDGSEAFNLIDGNFVVKGTSQGLFKTGDNGEGIWLRGPLNYVSNNVVANTMRAGYHIFSQNLPKQLNKPLFRGANPHDPLETEPFDPERTPWLGFVNNEVYASKAGIDVWSSSPEARQYISGFRAWHTSDNSFVLSNYVTSNVVIDGMNFVGDFAGVSPQRLQKFQPIPESGLQAVRQSSNLTIRNSTIRGVQTGIESPALQVERMLIQDSTIQAYTGIKIGRLTTGSFNSIGADVPYGSVTIENTRFESMPQNLAQPEQWRVYLEFDTSVSTGTNLLNTSEVFLVDFNGVKGANYRVYYLEQAPNFVVPTSESSTDARRNFTASPEVGLTNAQLFARHGVALGGAVAPSRQIDGDNGEAALARGRALGIRGLVFPMQSLAEAGVSAGPDLVVSQYQQVVLNGSVVGGAADWSKVFGPGEVVFSNFQGAATKATFVEPGEYVLRLTGSSANRRSFDDVQVRVLASSNANLAPRVNAGDELVLNTSNVANLVGDVRDDGKSPVDINWSVLSGPGKVNFANPSQAVTQASFAARGTYVLQLSANDGVSITTDTVTITVNAVISKSPLLGWWALDSATNSRAIDGSGNGLDAQIVGSFRTIPGMSGNAIELNGGYIALPVHDLLSPSQGMTVSQWIRPRAFALSQTLFNWEGGSWDAYGLVLNNFGLLAGLDVEVTTSVGINRFRVFTEAFSANSWTHLAMSFSNANGGEVKLYRNGIEFASRSGLGTGLSYRSFGTSQVTIGTEFAGSIGTSYTGGVDDVRIYDYALSALEVGRLAAPPNRAEGEYSGQSAGFWADDSSWHNRLSPTDVNGDGMTTPLDALITISQLSRKRTLEGKPRDTESFFDVNNDDTVSPIDALLIIDQLNHKGSRVSETDVGEGESDWSTTDTEWVEARRKKLSSPAS